jgi:uncharacterized membrane protein
VPTKQAPTSVAPRWAVFSSVAMSVVGLGVSIYLTIEHFTQSTTLACPATGIVNCQKVTESAQSSFLGIPVALLGALYFAAMVAVTLPAAWRSTNPALGRLRLGLAGVGVVFVLYLIYAELFILDAICLWCTVIHVISIALFAVIAIAMATADPQR